ncbi:MAG: hypothetical protein IT580_21435 [Verrucomicrobiales bacterium]|nr:hypothetical protein [Verrucomicrobiales bacterium]
MEGLKKFSGVFSAHYEKIILAVILLALLIAAGFLPIRVANNRDAIRQALDIIEKRGKKETQPVDTAAAEQMLKRTKSAPKLSLSGEHNVFNPVVWKRGRDGKLFKVVRGDEDGPGGLVANAIRALHFTVEYDGVQASGDSTRYKLLVTDESKAGRSAKARPYFLARGSSAKSDPLVVTKINGPEDNPTSVEVRFSDSTETAVISRETPFRRIAGYEADLAHEKLGTRFNNVRQKQPGGIRLGPQTYNIVAITKDEVTVQSSTSKRWTVPLKGTSER